MCYPKISIVTPVYNQAKYLEKTILSVLDQGYPNLEYIIIDGGSTDGTVDIIKKYENQLAYWVSEKDNGMYDAIQKGFMHSTGEIMAWINSDDLYYERCLFAIADVFNNHPEIEWFCGKATTIDENGMIVGCHDTNELRFCKYDFYLNRGFWVPQSSTVWRKSLWKKVGGLTTSLRLAGDFDLWLRFIDKAPLYIVHTIIGTYRIRKGQLSQSMDKYMVEVDMSLKNNPISSEDEKILKKYDRKLQLAEKIDKLKIFRGDRIVRLRYFVGRNKFYPPVIKYNSKLKHF